MSLASGLFRQVTIKKETTFGVAPATTLWTPLRRKRSNIDLSKETYQSEELATSMQVSDFRHGVRSVKGTLEAELAPGAFSPLYEAMLKKDWVAGVSIALAATTLDIGGAGPTYTLTRSAGSWIADGVKAGDMVRITVGAGLTASNRDKNLWVLSLTATVLTVVVMNGSGMVDDTPTATCTVVVFGKKTFAAPSSQTDYSYAIEHYHGDIVRNDLFTGCKFTKADINLPASGMSGCNFDVLGQNAVYSGARYSTTYNTINQAGLLAAVNGVAALGGAAIARLLSLKMSLMSPYDGDPVVGSNIVPALFGGRVTVQGEFTAYYEDGSIVGLFDAETETSLAIALTCNNNANSDFLVFSMQRVKLGGASKVDSDKALIMTCPFTALLVPTTTLTADNSTIAMQDSLA